MNNDASLVALEEHMSLEVDSRCYTADGVPCPEDAENSHLATVAIAIAVVAVMFTCCAVTAGVLLCVLHRKSIATSPTPNSIRPAQTATNPNFVPQQQQQGAVQMMIAQPGVPTALMPQNAFYTDQHAEWLRQSTSKQNAF